MPNTPTPTIGLTPPTVGSDINQWGAELNTDLALIDQLLGSADVRVINSNTILSLVRPLTILLVTAGALGVTITLPAPLAGFSRVVMIKKIDIGANPVALQSSSGNVEGGPAYFIANYLQAVILVPDSANWWAFGVA
jgi:hypothetical protein